jgi:hypothetical protein
VARPVTLSSYGNRKAITLSTKPLSTFSPVEDDEIDEGESSDERAHVTA